MHQGGPEGMLPRDILPKFSFSKMHILRIIKELTEKWTETFMCLAANWHLIQDSNEYIQIIGFQT